MSKLDLQSRLEELATKYGVVGASAAVLHDDNLEEAATGVLNVETGVEVTHDTLFQIGSTAKTYTATVAMRLVDEGLIGLDTPIIEVVEDFKVSDPDVTKSVTLRHLLSHSSGIDGDHFPDTGRGDDCIERYVATCDSLTQLYPLGATMSYCNSGYVVIGRIIEKLTDSVWDAAMHERLFAPLGLERTNTLPDDALRFRTAYGHMGRAGVGKTAADFKPTPVWHLPRNLGPAGLIQSTAKEVVEFARLHLRGGKAADGSEILKTETVALMQEPQVAVPDPYTLGSHWGLGWILFDWDGRRVIGHDGNTLGQNAHLRILPEQDLVIVLLTNVGDASAMITEFDSDLFSELAGVTVPSRPEPLDQAPEFDASRYIGTYERESVRMDVTAGDGELLLTTTATGAAAEFQDGDAKEVHSLRPVEDDLFVTELEEGGGWWPAVFFELDGGARFLHLGARATPKVG